jgi:aspartate kinase
VKVAKFGGSSVASAAKIAQVRDIIASDPARRVIVVSAPGKRHADDIKVTDLLINCAQRVLADHVAGDEVQAVVDRFQEIAAGLGLPGDLPEKFGKDLRERLAADKSHPGRFEDSIKAAGEDFNARLIAAYLAASGVAAHYVDPHASGLLVSEEYGQARVLPRSYDNLARLVERDGVIVYPGFFGYSPEGNLVTFSRGGSDLTGAILAKAVKAEVYENFTDVDGIAAADPCLVEDPVLIEELTYQELRELSYGGFNVFHEEAVMPALEAGIPINVKNTNNPSHPGTRVVVTREPVHGSIVGVACDDDYCAIYVGKYLMNREKGFGRKLLQIIEEEDVSFDHAPSGVDNITIVLKQDQLTATSLERITRRIRDELEADTIDIERDMAVISIVGIGMKHTVGICSRATGALAAAGANIEMIIQGPSELTMIIGVKEEEAPAAVRSIYNHFFLH